MSSEGLKILVVTECFWPDIYAINDIVEKLVKRGHKVTVLTGLPDYTTTKFQKNIDILEIDIRTIKGLMSIAFRP